MSNKFAFLVLSEVCNFFFPFFCNLNPKMLRKG